MTSLCQSSSTHELEMGSILKGLVLSFVSRVRGTVFKVRGPVTTSFEVVVVGGGGRGKFGCSLFVAV